MKNISLVLTVFFSSLSFSAVEDLETPLEMNSFLIEFREASKTGVIRVKGCNRCKQEFYEFNEDVVITRQGQIISIDILLNEYWDVKYPTIFLKANGTKATRISY